MQEISKAVLYSSLTPYRAKGAVYLKEAGICPKSYPVFKARGAFEIHASSYIRNTGHFNAAEFIICANQLLAASFAHFLFERNGEPGIAIFAEKYNDCLIAETHLKFRKTIDTTCFWGEVEIENCRSIRERAHIKVRITFGNNDREPKASGYMRIVLPKQLIY